MKFTEVGDITGDIEGNTKLSNLKVSISDNNCFPTPISLQNSSLSYSNFTSKKIVNKWDYPIPPSKGISNLIKKKNGISLIIPTKNEEKNIKHVFPHIPPIVDEIVIVDSSSDNTINEIKKYTPQAKIIKTEPRGKGNALKIGFQNASQDLVIMIDADGSMDPKEIPIFVEPLIAGADVSQGSRILGGSDDLTHFRRFGNFFFVSLVNYFYKSNYTDMCYGYRGFRKEVIDNIEFQSDGFDVETELSIIVCKKGCKIVEVPSFESERIHGVSNLCAFRDGLKILHRIFKERECPR